MSELAPITAVFTARVEPCPLAPRYVVVDAGFAGRLRTEHARRFEVTAEGDEQLTPDVPNVGEDALAHLDDDGVARVGTAVAPGTILAGKVTPIAGGPLSSEEKLLRAIFGEQAGELRDTSLRAPPGCFGVVTRTWIEADPALSGVEVGWERPLEVGDVLLVDGRPVVVAAIRELGADLAWSGGVGEASVAKAAMARDVLHARSIGPYDPTTQQPAIGRERFGGQPLERDHLERLAVHAPWALWEMLTIKSDSVSGRTRAYESIVKQENPDVVPTRGEPAPAGGGATRDIFSFFDRPKSVPGEPALEPEAVTMLVATLRALGLELDLRAAEVGLAILAPDALVEHSHGEVRGPDGVDGLGCPKIFGPTKDYECACGQYRRMKHRGVVCETCGVEVVSSRVRRERFGHVTLAAPCLHPLFAGDVATLLGLEEEELREVVAGRRVLEFAGSCAWRSEPGESAAGGQALWDALAQLDLDAIEASESGPRAELASSLARLGRPATALMLAVVPVLPPDLRVDDEYGDLDPLYRELLDCNARLARSAGTNAPTAELAREQEQLQHALDRLLLDGRRRRSAVDAALSISGRIDRLFAERLFTKTVDFSGVAHLVVDPSLAPDECRVPQAMLRELFRPHAYGMLETLGFVVTIKSAKHMIDTHQPEALAVVEAVSDGAAVLLMAGPAIVTRRVRGWDAPCVAVDPTTAERMASPAVTMHVPLMHEAALQCERLPDFPAVEKRRASGWLSPARRSLTAAARRAALHGERDRLDEPLVRLALGRPPESIDAAELERRAERERERCERAWERLKPPPVEPASNPLLDRRIDELELSVATSRALDRAGLQTLGELCRRTESELLEMQGFGRKQLAEVKQILADLGLSLGMPG
ncbi:DNA-directed RNA polymerase subunit alpha C-terminal domain-containing protein [Nannocystis sp. SCPEA4]|uniref:DNA-directed RNA polymerase subunit alpha C-terminal domain-containing protein n=1 Tax=Nannocystis sp. SCPEA4 TaxID=2996787 RepID=UPI0023EF3635|nr:DNA-directed RNA polymerase subunit alpha C-terminal domain-containing protein [Nannocystis sp. SCPEA4]